MQPNIIPLNEWVNHFEHFIIPIQPGEFDLTPILRAHYGNLLRDDVVFVRLFAEHRSMELIITEAGNTEQVVIDIANIMDKRAESRELDDLFFYDCPDNAPERNAPWEERRAWFNRMLPSLLWLFDSEKAAKHLRVFTPHYLALLERIQDNNNDADELRYENERLEKAVMFYEDCVQTLAKPIQEMSTQHLTSLLADTMKKREATGILSSELTTYWDEVGIIAEEGGGNLLYGILCSEIDSEVYDAIKHLSEAEQFSLWFYGPEVECNLAHWFQGDYENDVSSIKKDFSMIIKDIRDELLGMAMNSLSREAIEYLGY